MMKKDGDRDFPRALQIEKGADGTFRESSRAVASAFLFARCFDEETAQQQRRRRRQRCINSPPLRLAHCGGRRHKRGALYDKL